MDMTTMSYIEWFTILATMIGGFFMLSSKIEHQSSRTDRLYEMFIALLQEKK